MLKQTILLVLLGVKLIDAATIGLFFTSTCSGSPYETYTAYNDVCTGRDGRALTVYQCSDSYAKIYEYKDSASEKIKAPKCGTGSPLYVDATKTCTYAAPLTYTKLIESTCKAPTNTFIASANTVVCSSSSLSQSYSTITADGSCRRYADSDYYYTAEAGSSSNTLDFRTYNSAICNVSKPDAVWIGARTTGECLETSIKNNYESLQITTPATFLLSSSLVASAIGAIVGGIIGTIIWCFGCWGILHACGCVNCPCFNRCCDRRKNIASSASGSSPSYPSSSPYGAQMASPYGAQAPRASNPYGNVRHV